MLPNLYIFVGVGVLIVVTIFIWRLSSVRLSIPCPTWLGWMVELDNPVFRNNRAAVIIRHLGVGPGMRVLDFGCGPGRLTIPLARQVGCEGEVTAFDIQAGMLERVRAKCETEQLTNVRYVHGASGEGKLDQLIYDRAVLVTVLGEIPDPKTALSEIFESLKPTGVLAVTEVIADPHFQPRDKIRQVAASVGFTEKNFFGNRFSFTILFEKPLS